MAKLKAANGAAGILTYANMIKHLEFDCVCAEVLCTFCFQQIKCQDIVRHLDEECSENFVKCPQCLVEIKKSEPHQDWEACFLY